MNSLLSGLKGNSTLTPPETIIKDFETRFSNALNIEWSHRDDNYEAIFYCESKEHIASYSKQGLMINYKINISPPVLPEKLVSYIDRNHEIMNLVEIYSAGGTVTYEIITRDPDLLRYLFNLDSSGKIISRHSL